MNLVVIPCGKRKVWQDDPNAGPTPASLAYVGGFFLMNKRYAEVAGDAWLILSAKYGLIQPDFVIPEDYNVSFNRRASRPVCVETVRAQAAALHLEQYDRITVLGGKLYRSILEQAVAPRPVECPFSGSMGQVMRQIKVFLDKMNAGLPAGQTLSVAQVAERATAKRNNQVVNRLPLLATTGTIPEEWLTTTEQARQRLQGIRDRLPAWKAERQEQLAGELAKAAAIQEEVRQLVTDDQYQALLAKAAYTEGRGPEHKLDYWNRALARLDPARCPHASNNHTIFRTSETCPLCGQPGAGLPEAQSAKVETHWVMSEFSLIG